MPTRSLSARRLVEMRYPNTRPIGARLAACAASWEFHRAPPDALGVRRFVELGYPNPRPIGTGVAAAAALWGFYRAHRAARAGRLLPLIGAGAFAVHAYFMFAVQVHENHLYLAVPLLAIAAAVDP